MTIPRVNLEEVKLELDLGRVLLYRLVLGDLRDDRSAVLHFILHGELVKGIE